MFNIVLYIPVGSYHCNKAEKKKEKHTKKEIKMYLFTNDMRICAENTKESIKQTNQP